MDSSTFPIVFDGHNDVLLRLGETGGGGSKAFFERGEKGHLDLPRAREGGFGGGIFAIWVPSPENPERTPNGLPVALDADYALRYAMAKISMLFEIEASSNGEFRIVHTTSEIERCLHEGTMAAVLHLEGADAIDKDLDALHVFYRAGLRSLGLVWGRPNAFAEGVPSRFGGSADTGPGLTEAGRRLVRECNDLGVLLDLSHLNEQGFWDVASLSDAPLVASHSNAYTICPSNRNLTDAQLGAIADSDGIIGLNFGVHFLREDGVEDTDTPLEVMVRQIDYLVEKVGIEKVGLGSDFDGISVPDEIGDASGLPKLMAALRDRGYDDDALRRISHGNWLRILLETWGA